jgi:hypothetical protein
MMLLVDYQYDMEQAKSRLVKEGYALSEINKYSLKQLRKRCIIETDEKKEMPHLN